MVGSSRNANLQRVLESAATLQALVPDAVLVGGTAAALYAEHRVSLDHDHVLVDLVARYAEVIETVEASEGWATSVRASRPPATIMGSLDGVAAGIRQLRRAVPLEVAVVEVAPGVSVNVPTPEEILRIKAYLIVERNQVRDYLDVVALSEFVAQLDPGKGVRVLAGIDDYYMDRSGEVGSVLTSLIEHLAKPRPRDTDVISELSNYKGLASRWQSWEDVVLASQELAQGLISRVLDES